MNTFADTQFEVNYVYEFQTNANSYEDICWVSVWSYVSLWVSNKSGFLWRHLLSLSLKLCKLMSFKQTRILMKTFAASYFEVLQVYESQTKPNCYEDICWVSVWICLSLWVSNKRGFLWRRFLSLSLKLYKFTIFKKKQILMKTFAGSQFEVM